MKSKKTIGIDLGTGNSCVSIYEGNDVKVIPNEAGKNTTPSIVYIKSGEIKIGDSAKRMAITNPENTIYSVKRLIGKTYEQVKNLVLPYKIVNNDGRPFIKIDDKEYSPEEISAMILQKMKKTAEDFIGEEIENAIITVPAYWTSTEKEATKNAGIIAGLNVLRVINEPTAAALAYGLDKSTKSQKILIFDCGSGTHDISIIEIGDGVYEVLATDGDANLGGDDIDNLLIDWLANEFKSENGLDLRKDPIALQRLKETAEKAKIELSSTTSTDINLPYISSINNMPVHLTKSLNRASFNKMIDTFVQKTINPISKALDKAGLTINDINEVVLVGGSTRIPYIQDEVSKYFGDKKLNKSLNPDESVSIGATIQGGVLSGNITDVLLLDVTPLSLGIETMNGIFTKLIDANTTIPYKKTEIFSTASDNQPAVTINIAQGERSLFKDNKSIGMFTLDGIAPAPRGIPQIEVTIDIDANSIVHVSAKDKNTGKEQKIKIESSTGLSKEEIEQMKKDAELNAESDKKQLEEIQILNGADSQIFTTEKQVKEHSDKLSDDTKSKIELALNDLKEAYSNKDFEKIKISQDNLNKVWEDASKELYANMPKDSNSPQNPFEDIFNNPQNMNSTPNDESPIDDVPFEEVK